MPCFASSISISVSSQRGSIALVEEQVALRRNRLVWTALWASSVVVTILLFFSSCCVYRHTTTTTTDRQTARQTIALSHHRPPYAAAFNRRTDNCNHSTSVQHLQDRQTVVISGKQIANCKLTAQHYSTDRQTDGQLQYRSIRKTDMLY